jgi:hypothetical protein
MIRAGREKREMRSIFALALAGLLTGCATGPSLESQLAAYIGAPEAGLVQKLGVPNRQINVNGVDYLAYQVRYQAQTFSGGSYYWGGPFWGPGWGAYGSIPQDVQVWSCEATFALVKGKVASFSLRGNDCR